MTENGVETVVIRTVGGPYPGSRILHCPTVDPVYGPQYSRPRGLYAFNDYVDEDGRYAGPCGLRFDQFRKHPASIVLAHCGRYAEPPPDGGEYHQRTRQFLYCDGRVELSDQADPIPAEWLRAR